MVTEGPRARFCWTHPVLGAVGVELQRVQALWCARNLRFDVSAQQTVRHVRAVTDGQDLQRSSSRSGQVRPRPPRPRPPRPRPQQSHHVLVEGGLSLAACQREDGGGRQGTEVPQGQGRTAAAQLQPQHGVSFSVSISPAPQQQRASTIQSESVAKQLIHFPY